MVLLLKKLEKCYFYTVIQLSAEQSSVITHTRVSESVRRDTKEKTSANVGAINSAPAERLRSSSTLLESG